MKRNGNAKSGVLTVLLMLYANNGTLIKVLIILLAVNLVSGLAAEAVSGSFSLKKIFLHLARAAVIISVIVTAGYLDAAMCSNSAETVTVVFYIRYLCVCMFENCEVLNIPIPPMLESILLNL